MKMSPSSSSSLQGVPSTSSSFLRVRSAGRPRVVSLRSRGAVVTTRAIGKLFGGGEKQGAAQQTQGGSNGLFAAKKRAEVRIPGFIFTVSPGEATATEGNTSREAIEAAVAAGATAVVLADESGDATTRDLFNAALALKDALRGRAALLVADRTDIAASAEADGVVLSDDGVPPVVARKALQGPCVVACRVTDEAAALVAAKEGADLILAPDPRVVAAVNGKISVPTFAPPDGTSTWGGVGGGGVRSLVEAGAQGVFLTSAPPAPNAADGVPSALAAINAALAKTKKGKSPEDQGGSGSPENAAARNATSTGRSSTLTGKIIDEKTQELLDRERVLLDDAVAFLETSVKTLEEINLLVDARRGLEELFLLVIVGEFNAGKSSVINAVLGAKHLKEGILPTTNEITVLRHGDKARTEQSSDGFYTQYIPADLLKEVNIVDTPGTNVILERQQRLTEEFVPRADLVLFVLSADRPMTESEVKFLSYIRKWGKKVVFIVNKCDRLENADEVAEVKGFVADNAERLLGVTEPTVLPVSAKQALNRKLAGESMSDTGFDDLEDYVLSFLGGGGGGASEGGSRSGEGLRLKLGTPLQVGTLLFDAAEDILAGERSAAAAEVAAAAGVEQAMESYRAAMEADFGAQRDAVRSCVLRATERCDELLDSTLRLTNGADLFMTFVVGDGRGVIKDKYNGQVLGAAEKELRAALTEHTGWLARNNEMQLRAYEDAVRSRGFDPSLTNLNLDTEMSMDASTDEEEDDDDSSDEMVLVNAATATEEAEETGEAEETNPGGALVEAEMKAQKAAEERAAALPSTDSIVSKAKAAAGRSAVRVAAGFNQEAAAVLLEEEVREAVYSTVGAAGTAFFVAIFLSGFLDNLAEDVLAFSLTAAVGYVSVLSLPLKRAETKSKVRRVAESFLAEIEAAMQAEFDLKVGATVEQVRATVAPWEAAARKTEAEVAANQATRDKLAGDMEQLQREVQSL